MPSDPQYSISQTSKAYTVVFQCVDPPQPVVYFNTNDEKAAKAVFEGWKEAELENTKRSGMAGEWTLTLYKHTPDTKLKAFRSDDGDVYSDRPYIYALLYEGSEILASLDWADDEVLDAFYAK